MKICVCTGTRAEYGLLKPLLFEIKKSKKLELQLAVSGMHLLERFGNTIEEIKKDGFEIDAELDVFFDRDSGKAMAESIGNAIGKFSECFEEKKPDLVVLLGDRAETFAAAVSASCMNIAIAHFHGGDTAAAGLDEIFRYSITKFANIHFPATKKSSENIIRMGEEKWRIHIVGAPGLDSIMGKKLPSKKEICKKLCLDEKKPFLLVLQHSITTEPENSEFQMRETMEAVKKIGIQAAVIYPNSDAGGRKMIEVIEEYGKLPFIRIFKNLEHNDFLALMKNASAMVGNSSSGIIESPSFCLPVVNIGTRQKGRERAKNVIDAPCDRKKIQKAILKALHDKRFLAKAKKCENPYGKGNSAKRVVKILESLKINSRLLQKKMI